jgi:hypothetical protein
MIQKEYALPLASGSFTTGAHELLPGEWLAGLRAGGDLTGNIHIQDGVTLAGPFNDVYDREDKLFKWKATTSGAYHLINNGLECQFVRFRVDQAATTNTTIYLRVTQKHY